MVEINQTYINHRAPRKTRLYSVIRCCEKSKKKLMLREIKYHDNKEDKDITGSTFTVYYVFILLIFF